MCYKSILHFAEQLLFREVQNAFLTKWLSTALSHVHAHKSGQTKKRYTLVKHTDDYALNETKERDKHACMHMHVCMHVPTAAQPHLKGVRVRTTCTSVSATISLIHPLCRSVCPYMYANTYTYTNSHTFNTFTQAQYSVNSHEKHENSPKR